MSTHPSSKGNSGTSARPEVTTSRAVHNRTATIKSEQPSLASQDLSIFLTRRTMVKALCYVVLAVAAALGYSKSQTSNFGPNASISDLKLPPNAVLALPSSFAVISQSNSSFRPDFSSLFNPTSTAPPFFQVFDSSFISLLIPRDAPQGFVPFLREVSRNDSFAFAHEAPVFVRRSSSHSRPVNNVEAAKIAQGTIFFSSNDGGALGFSDINNNNQVFRLELGDVASLAEGQFLEPEHVPLPDFIQMTNGGTPFHHKLLLANSGRGDSASSPQHTSNLALVEPNPPYNATVVLDNFFGRPFNSLNDLKILRDGKGGEAVFFTDAPYGFLNAFRSEPQLPNQVYRLDMTTGAVRVVADGFDKCNGIAFDASGKVAYVTDTGVIEGNFGNDQKRPATIYKFDVEPTTQTFVNRRIFAFVDTGVPDGVNVDELGNVYSGCGDGVHVWNPSGTLIGKIFVGKTSANFAFVNDDLPNSSGKGGNGGSTLVVLAETSVYLARLAVRGVELDL